ncbi:hypothetical protein POV27_06680 [Aureisphaera galaxeae]|uniref:hypothetical protein n=1 Tax=Aureisphaera galaxeae TaxID=1538023 RepID=UPI002350BF6D|nr:hypothetical protein [Aureisphaera galaxeae]MDC8003729.1 hypothetical protein [Aureisphaera galaxeae]
MHEWESEAQIEFDKAFINRGGLYYLSSFHPEDREAARLFRANVQEYLDELCAGEGLKERGMKIHFDFLNNIDFDASAKSTKDGSLHFIGISIGLYQRLFAMMESFIASTDLFNEIEGVDPNASEKKIPATAILNKTLPEVAQIYHRIPSGTVRSHLSYACWYMMLQYIVYHELAHILTGHTAYLNGQAQGELALGENGEGQYLGEIIRKGVDEGMLIINERQAMEIDADEHAVYWSIIDFVRGNCKIFPQKGLKLPLNIYMRLLTYSLGLMVHFWDEYNGHFPIMKSLLEYNERHHPHNEIRFNWMYSAMISSLEKDITDYGNSIDWGIQGALPGIVVAIERHLEIPAFPTSFHPDNEEKVVKKVMKTINDEILPDFRKNWKSYKMIPDHPMA